MGGGGGGGSWMGGWVDGLVSGWDWVGRWVCKEAWHGGWVAEWASTDRYQSDGGGAHFFRIHLFANSAGPRSGVGAAASWLAAAEPVPPCLADVLLCGRLADRCGAAMRPLVYDDPCRHVILVERPRTVDKPKLREQVCQCEDTCLTAKVLRRVATLSKGKENPFS